jgi:hypothetical protein
LQLQIDYVLHLAAAKTLARSQVGYFANPKWENP